MKTRLLNDWAIEVQDIDIKLVTHIDECKIIFVD